MDKYISLKVILDNITDHPLLKDVSIDRAINYTVSFIRIVGCPDIFLENTALVEIKDHRGVLPCDVDKIILVRTHTDTQDYQVFRYASDNFHMSPNKQLSFDLTYKVLNSVIITSLENGIIEISYRGFAVDKDGYPLIPDNSSFIRALELYIKKNVFTVLFDTNKISQAAYNNVCQEYAWAVGQAQSSLIMPTVDQMQTITNSLNTLIPRVTEHSRGFVNNGSQERIKLH